MNALFWLASHERLEDVGYKNHDVYCAIAVEETVLFCVTLLERETGVSDNLYPAG